MARKLWEYGVAGSEMRGLDPALVDWLKAQGSHPFPEDPAYWEGYSGPTGYEPYFRRLWNDW